MKPHTADDRTRHYRILFLLCWISYFSTYIGRQNFTAVMAVIVEKEGFLNSACGMVGTGFFICYGVGQIFSGFLGDRHNPKYMIFFGILISAVINLIMGVLDSPFALTAAWCINGAAQSMTWSPLLRIFSEYLPGDRQKKACMDIATTYPAAIMTTYPLCSMLVYLSGWRVVFWVCGIFMLLVSCLWLVGFTKLERVCPRQENKPLPVRLDHCAAAPEAFHYSPLILLFLTLTGCMLAIQGVLRDGVTSWVPSYLTNTYHVGAFLAIFATTLLPIINLFGIFGANLIYRKFKKDELQTSSILFVVAAVSIFGLIVTEGISLILSLFFFSVTTSCMMGTNMMLVSFIPTYFIRWGKVSTISGLLNSTVYIGSSIATYGLGAVADHLGWSILLKVLGGAALLGVLISIPAGRAWKHFKNCSQPGLYP